MSLTHVPDQQKRLDQATDLLTKLRVLSVSEPRIQLPDPTVEWLPLPPIKPHPDCGASDTATLLVFQARIDLRTAILQIQRGIDHGKDGRLNVDKRNWREIRNALQQISKDGSPDDLFEATMDFMYLVYVWLEALWRLIVEKKELRMFKEEQMRLEEYWHLIERSPKRSRATILAISEFLNATYKTGRNLLEPSMSWPACGNRHKILEAFVARIERWKEDSNRLTKALSEDGHGLLACSKEDDTGGKDRKSGAELWNSGDGASNAEREDDVADILGDSDADDSDASEDGPTLFTPPPRSKDPAVWQELNDLIGLEPVKRHLLQIIATVAVGKQKTMPTMHLMLSGNPGVGKTTVARLYARVLKDLKVLKGGHLVEEKLATLSGKYLGQSENITKQAIEKAQGGVLFIDEAHHLCPEFEGGNNHGYGKQILDVLLPELENQRSSFVVIFATYASKVEAFFNMDPGLRRRVSNKIHFPDYSDSELTQILEAMAAKEGYELEPDLSEKVGKLIGKMRGTNDFGNAGTVRNAFEQAQLKLNTRNYKKGIKDNLLLTAKDFRFLKEWLEKSKDSLTPSGD